MVLINLHRNLHEKSSFLSEIMFIRINPYLCHLLTRYQSTIFPNHKSCVRKKGVPTGSGLFLLSSDRRLWRPDPLRGLPGGSDLLRRGLSGMPGSPAERKIQPEKSGPRSALRGREDSPAFGWISGCRGARGRGGGSGAAPRAGRASSARAAASVSRRRKGCAPRGG